MLRLTINNEKPLQNDMTRLSNDYQQWKSYYQKGCQLHQLHRFTCAIHYFLRCFTIGNSLKDNASTMQLEINGIGMMFSASHNLAACHNAIGNNKKATEQLSKTHAYLMATATNTFKERALRMEALANLDKSLFSLSSQLAYENQVTKIHSLILETENVAASVAEELLT